MVQEQVGLARFLERMLTSAAVYQAGLSNGVWA